MIKKIDMAGFSSYYVSEYGRVFNEKSNGKMKELSISKVNGMLKVNLYSDSRKSVTKLVHTLVYETFKSKDYSSIVFLDGNKENCHIDNLMSVEELRDFYNATVKNKQK